MSTQTFSGIGKKSSSRVLQRPGGNTSIDLFGSGAPAQPQQRHQRRGSRTGNVSANSPFGKGAQQPQQQRPSKAVPRNNPTYTPNAASPFSNAPLPQQRVNPRVTAVSNNSPFGGQGPNQPVKARRPQPKANKPSQQSPFNPQGSAPAPRKQRQFAANQPSGSSPFNPNAPQQQQPRRNSRTQQPQRNPLQGGAQVRQSKSSVRLHQTPGGTQNVNLFGGVQQVERNVRQTPTYQSSQQAPWNPNAPEQQRAAPREIKANAMSTHNPLSPDYDPNAEDETQQVRRPAPRANIPDKQSPFSKEEVAPLPRRNSRNFHTSATNPLNVRQNSAPKARNNAIRIQQTPGGKQSVNLFGANSYGNR